MFQVKGMPILASELDVLTELKRQVYVKTGRDILRKIKPSGNNIMICCPVHNDGQERRPSCGITTRSINGQPPGTVHCFACGYTDSLEGMISKCFGYSDYAFGEKWLLENFVSVENDERPNLELDFSRDRKEITPEYITEQELASYRYYHPYMYQRKLTNEIIEKYDVGYQSDFVFDKGWRPTEVVTFPVRDKNGNCLFVSRRAIHDKNFFLPKDIQKPIYGVYELPKNATEVLVCESVFNALTSVAYGRPAVALFGTGDKFQYQSLKSLPVRKFVIAFDPDSAGDKGTERIKWWLKDRILTKLIVPKGKDINDLSYDEFYSLPEILI